MAINLHPSKSIEQTILDWLDRNHPEYPQNKIRLWEDSMNIMGCNPYTDIYNVVYFIDAQPGYTCLRISGVHLYTGPADHVKLQNFPLPLEEEKDYSRPPIHTFVPPIITGQVEADVSLDDLTKRIDWICNDRREDGPLYRDDPAKEYVSRRILGLIPWEERKWIETRLSVEYEAFMSYFAAFRDMHVPLMGKLPKKTIQPSIPDLQMYKQYYPEDTEPPTHWFEVDASDISANLMETLLLYQGYKVHIHYRYLPDWFWTQYTLEECNVKSHIWQQPGPMQPQLRHVMDYAMERALPKIKKHKYQKRKPEVSQGIGDEIVDIEDMMEVVPPCIRGICDMKRGRFPQHEERKALVSVLRVGEIPLETIEGLLDGLNEAYPHQGGVLETRKRFDFISYYEGDYKPPGCEKMKSHCPFEGSVDKRKEQCHRTFQEAHPNKYKPWHANRFYGPASWLYWVK